MRSVTCPDCGEQVEIPVVSIGDESVIVYCKNCLWKDLDQLYGRRGLVVFSGDVAEMACWTCVPPGGGLQGAINALPTGGIIMLQSGTYTGDITLSSGSMTIIGTGMTTILTGSVSITASNTCLRDLQIRATGKAYGIKIYQSGGGVARCDLRNLYVGGTADNSNPPVRDGNGPDNGLYLDGAIVSVVDHCTFAYCNTNGLYVNTSVSQFSTNVNSFRDCTFNGNGNYGVMIEKGSDGVAGMMLHKFEGGNMESNDSGEFYADFATFVIIRGVDFECGKNHVGGQIIFMNGCQPVVIEDCNFVVSGGAVVTRFFQLTSCADASVRRNRLSGTTWAQGAVGVFGENCFYCTSSDNILNGDGETGLFINNRGAMRV